MIKMALLLLAVFIAGTMYGVVLEQRAIAKYEAQLRPVEPGCLNI